jgi:hypothetical protein
MRPKLQLPSNIDVDMCSESPPYAVHLLPAVGYMRTLDTPHTPTVPRHTSPGGQTQGTDGKSHEREEESRNWASDLQQRVKTGLDRMQKNQSSAFGSMVPESVRGTKPPAMFTNAFSERPESKLEGYLQGGTFNAACAFVVLVNAIIIGIQVDARARDALSLEPRGDPKWFSVADLVFTCYYVGEVLLRVLAQRCSFFCCDDWGWNVFDLMHACYSIIEESLSPYGMYGGTYTPIFRVLRLVRMIRLLRLIRVMRFFRDLRLMTCSLIRTWMTLFWALVLLWLFIYIWTIVFMTMFTDDFAVSNKPDVDRSKLERYFGDVPTTMYTLVQAISGGNDWYVFAETLDSVSGIFRYLFVLYVLFVFVGVLNVLTSVFVERAREMSKLDVDLVIQGEINSQQAFYEAMARVFHAVRKKNQSCGDRITWQMFSEYLRDDNDRAYLATQQLDAWEARDLFNHMEADENGVTEAEFVTGCAKLRGQAKSSHIATLLRETKKARDMHKKVLEKLRHFGAEVTRTRTGSTSPPMYGHNTDLSRSELFGSPFYAAHMVRRMSSPTGDTPASSDPAYLMSV